MMLIDDAPLYIDLILGVYLAIAALAHYVEIAFVGSTVWRWLSACGWTGLILRILWSIALGKNPPIANVSVPLMMMAAGGGAIAATLSTRRMWADARCIADPTLTCQREDRVREAVLRRMGR